MYIELTETNASFRRKVINAICADLSIKFLLATKNIKSGIQKEIGVFFKVSKEYYLMTTDTQIRADLGFPAGTERNHLDAVIDKIVDNIYVNFTPLNPKGGTITGGIEIGIMLSDFSDVLSIPQAVIPSNAGHLVEWLKWILLEGDRIIISTHDVVYGNFGRSKEGHMTIGGVWRVNSNISGTKNNNWLTRTVDKYRPDIQTMFDRIVSHEISRVI